MAICLVPLGPVRFITGPASRKVDVIVAFGPVGGVNGITMHLPMVMMFEVSVVVRLVTIDLAKEAEKASAVDSSVPSGGPRTRVKFKLARPTTAEADVKVAL